MAKFIPFKELKVGETYYMQSRYWHRVLGKATIETIDIPRGIGTVFTDWNPNSSDGCGWCVIYANEDFMWDEMPTEEQQHELIMNISHYI